MKQLFFKILILISGILFFSCNTVSEKETTDAQIKPNSKTISVADSININSEITCPKCGHKEMETMPTDVCLIKYNCKKCNVSLFPKDSDCCVFCSYGTSKCPSKSEK